MVIIGRMADEMHVPSTEAVPPYCHFQRNLFLQRKVES